MRFNISRWKFWWAYGAVILLALLAMWNMDRANDSAALLLWIICGALFILLEILIRTETIVINNREVKRVVMFKTVQKFTRAHHSVKVSQSSLQKGLRFGGVVIDADIVMSGVSDPQKIRRLLE